MISKSAKYDHKPLERAEAGNPLLCCSCPQEDAVIEV